MTINEEIGYYKQRDIERLNVADLTQLRDFAIEMFNAQLDIAPDGEGAAYFELLAGACDDLILDRRKK